MVLVLVLVCLKGKYNIVIMVDELLIGLVLVFVLVCIGGVDVFVIKIE